MLKDKLSRGNNLTTTGDVYYLDKEYDYGECSAFALIEKREVSHLNIVRRL